MTFHLLYNIIWIDIFHIDKTIEKVMFFMSYIIDFITHFYNTLINIKPLLINVFVLLDILSNSNKYK